MRKYKWKYSDWVYQWDKEKDEPTLVDNENCAEIMVDKGMDSDRDVLDWANKVIEEELEEADDI